MPLHMHTYVSIHCQPHAYICIYSLPATCIHMYLFIANHMHTYVSIHCQPHAYASQSSGSALHLTQPTGPTASLRLAILTSPGQRSAQWLTSHGQRLARSLPSLGQRSARCLSSPGQGSTRFHPIVVPSLAKNFFREVTLIRRLTYLFPTLDCLLHPQDLHCQTVAKLQHVFLSRVSRNFLGWACKVAHSRQLDICSNNQGTKYVGFVARPEAYETNKSLKVI